MDVRCGASGVRVRCTLIGLHSASAIMGMGQSCGCAAPYQSDPREQQANQIPPHMFMGNGMATYPQAQPEKKSDEPTKPDEPKKEDEASKSAQPPAPGFPPAPIPPLPPAAPVPGLPVAPPVAPNIPPPPILDIPISYSRPPGQAISQPTTTHTIQPVFFPFPSNAPQEAMSEPKVRKRRDEAMRADDVEDPWPVRRERSRRDQIPAFNPYNEFPPSRKLKSALKSSSSTPLSSPFLTPRQFSDSDLSAASAKNVSNLREAERLFGRPTPQTSLPFTSEIYPVSQAPLETPMPDPFDESAWSAWRNPPKDYKSVSDYSPPATPPIPSAAPVYTPATPSRLVLRDPDSDFVYPELDYDLQAFADELYTEKSPATAPRRGRPKFSHSDGSLSAQLKWPPPSRVSSPPTHEEADMVASNQETLPLEQQLLDDHHLSYLRSSSAHDFSNPSAQAQENANQSTSKTDIRNVWQSTSTGAPAPAPMLYRPQTAAPAEEFQSGFEIPNEWQTSTAHQYQQPTAYHEYRPQEPFLIPVDEQMDSQAVAQGWDVGRSSSDGLSPFCTQPARLQEEHSTEYFGSLLDFGESNVPPERTTQEEPCTIPTNDSSTERHATPEAKAGHEARQDEAYLKLTEGMKGQRL